MLRKLTLALGVFTCFAVVPSAKATVTINFIGGQLLDASNNPLQDGALIQILCTINGASSFSAPTTSGFVGTTEYLLGSFALDSSTYGDPGSFYQPITFDLDSVVKTGAMLTMRWWSTLEYSSAPSAPLAGTSYGETRSDLVSTWIIPGDSNSVNFTFLTSAIGGALPDSAGQASLTVVPEPSTYALGGLLALGALVIVRRRKGK